MNTSKSVLAMLKAIPNGSIKDPVIMISDKDFQIWKDELSSELVDFKVGINPTFMGIPVIARFDIEVDSVFIGEKPLL